jgi:hypothetical protein
MTGFLDLPGEIRNRIYSHICPEQQILLRCSHPNKSLKPNASRGHSDVSKRSSQLYATVVLPEGAGHHQHELVFSAPLLRVCRKIHEEVLPLLYTSVAFHFQSMKAVNCFLNGAPGQGLQQITKLAITQPGYGEPCRTSNTTWKAKHDQRWMSNCKRIAQEMTGVQHLKLCLQICDWPCQLNLSSNWAKPLFFLKGPEGLSRVDLDLQSSSFPKQRLEATARVVERAMTSEGGRAQRQLEESLQEIARREKQRCARPTRQVLKDTTNFASSTHCDAAIKLPKAVKVLTIKEKKDQKRPRHMAM